MCVRQLQRASTEGSTHRAVLSLLLPLVLARCRLHRGNVRLARHRALVLRKEACLALPRSALEALLLHREVWVLRREGRGDALLVLLLHLPLLLLLLVPLVGLHDAQLVVPALGVLLRQLADLRLESRLCFAQRQR